MQMTQLTTNLNIIQALADTPNATSGLTAAQLKAKFDEGPNDIKDFINNTLIPEIQTQMSTNLDIISVIDYYASGSALSCTGSITSGTKILTLIGPIANFDFVVGQGINAYGNYEVASLLVTAGCSSSVNCTVTLDGIPFTVALTSGNTATQVATAIRAATFVGWTTGGSGTTVTFTSLTTGTKTDATYSAGSTGATGTMTTTTQGTADLISSITGVSGLVLTLADSATTTVTGNTVEHDETVALNAALTAAPEYSEVRFPGTRYNISGQVALKSNLFLTSNLATIKSSNRILGGYFVGTSLTNINIKGFIFDQNQPILQKFVVGEYANHYNTPINLTSCTNIDIEKNQFINLYNVGLFIYLCNGLVNIQKNVFKSLLQPQNLKAEHVYVLTFDGEVNIKDNEFENAAYTDAQYGVCGVFMSGTTGKASVINNRFDYCGRNNTGNHRLGVIDFYGNSQNVTIKDNVSTHTCWHFTRLNGIDGGHIKDNKIYISIAADMPIINLGCTDIAYTYRNILIEDNLISSIVTNTIGVGGLITDYSRPHKNVTVRNNIFDNIRSCIVFSGVYENLSIENNIDDCGTIQDGIAVSITLESTATAINGVTQATSKIRGVKINGNTIVKHVNAIFIDLRTYTGNIQKTFQIEGNELRGKDNTGGQGIHTLGVNPLNIGNSISDFNIGLYLRSNAVAYSYSNLLYGCSSNITLDALTTHNKANNWGDDVAI